ncbi:MAG: transposase [Thermus sp.]|nr:transposase [Thermus sp.]
MGYLLLHPGTPLFSTNPYTYFLPRPVIGVDPRYTSQDCPVCGHREKRPLWVREFTCPVCGTTLHRDIAAAQNILAKAWVTGVARILPGPSVSCARD